MRVRQPVETWRSPTSGYSVRRGVVVLAVVMSFALRPWAVSAQPLAWPPAQRASHPQPSAQQPPGYPPTAPVSNQLDEERTAAVILLKNAILAVNQGNLTGNYTVLRDLASPSFRERNSAADLAIIFQNLRQKKIDLSPIVVLDPVMNHPRVGPDGQLLMEGYFASQPLRINFQLAFLKASGSGWMIHSVTIGAVPGAAATAERQGQPAYR